VSNKTNASAQLNNYREIASAIKKSIEASGRVPPHKSVGAVLYRFLCTVSGNDVTLRSNIWSATDWENATTNASIKYTLTESEHVKWNNVQAAVDTLLSQIVFSNKDDIFGLFLKWIKSEKETSMYTPSGFLPHGITETIKTHNESEKQKTFNLLRRVFKTNYDSTLIHIVNAMAEQPSTEDTFVALSEKAMAELLKHEAENIKFRAINSSLTAANNNLRHNDNNNPDILKITKESVFNRLKGLFPDNKAELIKELTDSFANNHETKNKYHVAETAELFAKDVDIHHYKNQIECLLHEAKVKSMKIVELEQQIVDLHRRYTTPVITVGSVAPTTPKEPEFDSKAAIEHLRTLVSLQETRLQKLEQTKIAHNSTSGIYKTKNKPLMSDIVAKTKMLFMTIQDSDGVIDNKIINNYNVKIQDMFLEVEREVVNRTQEAIKYFTHAGFNLNISLAPIPNMVPMCTRLIQVSKEGRGLSLAFHDGMPFTPNQQN
jgi:hypothetical protein